MFRTLLYFYFVCYFPWKLQEFKIKLPLFIAAVVQNLIAGRTLKSILIEYLQNWAIITTKIIIWHVLAKYTSMQCVQTYEILVLRNRRPHCGDRTSCRGRVRYSTLCHFLSDFPYIALTTFRGFRFWSCFPVKFKKIKNPMMNKIPRWKHSGAQSRYHYHLELCIKKSMFLTNILQMQLNFQLWNDCKTRLWHYRIIITNQPKTCIISLPWWPKGLHCGCLMKRSQVWFW